MKAFLKSVNQIDERAFSHHPNLPCFDDHVWYWRGYYWCKGCVVSFAGFLLGVIIQLSTGWLGSMSEELVGLVFIGLLIPTVITSLTGASRPAKHISRLLLGILFGSAFLLLFVTDRWLVRFVVIGTFFAVRNPLEKRRKRQNDEIAQKYREQNCNKVRTKKSRHRAKKRRNTSA